jgi:hypothetical protein
MHNLRATLIAPNPKREAFQPPQPLTQAYSLVGTYKGELKELVCLRIYQGTGATVKANIWVQASLNGENGWRNGRGSAGGYGYCKASAAADEALTNAGIQLMGSAYGGHVEVDYRERASISGVGTTAIEAALLAIGKLINPRSKFLIVRH